MIPTQHLERASASSLTRDKRGGVLPLIAVGFLAISAATAIGIDLGKLYLVENALQTTADFAALAAADRMMNGGTTQEVYDLVAETARRNLPPEQYGAVIPSSQVEFGNWDSTTSHFTPGAAGSGNAIRVTASRSRSNDNPVTTSFGAFFGKAKAEVRASAVALLQPSAPLCILQLNPTASIGIDIWGNAQVIADDCVVHANSTSGQAIKAGTSAMLRSLQACAVGGYSGTGYDPNPIAGCDPVADPLASVTIPPAFTPAHPVQEISPGVFQLAAGDHGDLGESYITVNSGETYILEPGRHFFNNLTVMGGGTIQGTDVMILYGNSSGTPLDIRGGATVNISGRESGPAPVSPSSAPPSHRHPVRRSPATPISSSTAPSMFPTTT